MYAHTLQNNSRIYGKHLNLKNMYVHVMCMLSTKNVESICNSIVGEQPKHNTLKYQADGVEGERPCTEWR